MKLSIKRLPPAALSCNLSDYSVLYHATSQTTLYSIMQPLRLLCTLSCNSQTTLCSIMQPLRLLCISIAVNSIPSPSVHHQNLKISDIRHPISRLSAKPRLTPAENGPAVPKRSPTPRRLSKIQEAAGTSSSLDLSRPQVCHS